MLTIMTVMLMMLMTVMTMVMIMIMTIDKVYELEFFMKNMNRLE